MERITTNLKENFKRGSIFIRLIYINVGIFLVMALLSIGFLLFNQKVAGFFLLFELPASFPRLLTQPWSLISYMFMHGSPLHLLFNMLWLYWFGALFLQLFSSKHLRGLYLLGGICGGALFMLSYNIFPYFRPYVPASSMVGASASILAIVAATAYRAPNQQIRLLLFGNVRLKYLALGVILLDVVFLSPSNLSATSLGSNAGGHIAHIGGALAGVWFAASLNKGADLTAWINRLLDGLLSLFSRRERKKKRKPTMKVHYNREKDYEYNANKKKQSEEVDRILDKLKKSGYESLSTEEKKSLFDASKK